MYKKIKEHTNMYLSVLLMGVIGKQAQIYHINFLLCSLHYMFHIPKYHICTFYIVCIKLRVYVGITRTIYDT
jgi:hypothetical protein